MDEPPGQDKSAERLRNMSEDDFQELLEDCVNRKTGSAYTEFIEEIQNNVSKVPEESQTGLTNTKCNSSSLQSLDARDKGNHSKQHTASEVYGHQIESQSSLIITNCSSVGSSMKAAAGTSYSYQSPVGRESSREDFKDRSASDYSSPKANHVPLENLDCTTPNVEYQRDNSYSKLILNSPPSGSATSAFASRHLNSNLKHLNRKLKFKKHELSVKSEQLADNRLSSPANWTVDAALSFIGVDDNVKVEKRGPKRKDLAGKEKHGASDTLGKSLSLDDDNLRMAEKKSAGTGKDRYSSLKDFDEANSRSEEEGREITDLSMPNSSSLRKKATDRSRPIQNKCDTVDDKQVSDIQDCNFTVVTRKKKNKTASITSPTDNMKSIAGGRTDTRRNRTRSDRRKSVDSAHGSENSEGSDDGSVRSLPAGGCSRKETVQKSCASSGGTPQTSYADITRLAKDEEILLKDSSQTNEEYPSLHASDNCDVSEDGSCVSGGSGKRQKATIAVTGGGALTSYATIAKSIRQNEKRDDGKPSVIPHDFPELPVGPRGNVVHEVNSPTSDPGYSADFNGNSESAFPDLSGNTMKHSAIFNVKGTDVVARNRVVSESSFLSETVPISSSNQPTTTSLRNISSSYSAKCASTFFSGNSAEPRQFKSPFSQSTASTSPLVNVSEHVDLDDKVDEVQLFNVPHMVNGHNSLEYIDIDSASDNDGAKSKNTVSKPNKSFHGISELNAGGTEAVVFCGRNFKQQPVLPDNDFFFGVDFNENISPTDDGITHANNATHSAVNHFVQVQNNIRGYDRSVEIGFDANDSSDAQNPHNPYKSETGYGPTKRGGHESQNGDAAKSYVKKGKQFVPVDPHLGSVSAMIPGMEPGAPIVAFPVTPVQPHPGTPLGPNVYGIPGYHPIPFQGHAGAMVQSLPGMLQMGVPIPQVPFDGKTAAFSPPIAFIPAAIAHVSPMPAANTGQGGPVGHLDGREPASENSQEQESPELHGNEGHENNELHPVPEQNEEMQQQYTPEEVVTYSPAVAIPTSSPNVYVITHPFNFAQFYLSPDVSLYSHANVDGLRSYLEKREQECTQLQNQARVRSFV